MKALQNISTLTKLRINDNNINFEAAGDIAAAISCNTQLEEFDVSGNDLGVVDLAIALERVGTLIKLNMSNNNITCTAANAIAGAITHNTNLQVFIINGNHLEAKDAIRIANSLQRISTLTKLYIANTSISDEAADDIADAISSNIHLQEFDISRNHLEASGVTKIAKGLQKISTLTKLYVNDNEITYEAADDIAQVILINPHLQKLDISSSNLQARGAIMICKCLRKISSLTTLYINKNNITYEAADDIAEVVSCNAMQVLDVSDNHLGTIGITKIAIALQSVCTLTHFYISNNNITDNASDVIAVAISFNPCLEEFDIGENSIQGRGAIKLARSFQQISTLKKLFLDDNMITNEASHDLAAAIKCNPHLNELRISENRITESFSIKHACFANGNQIKVDL